MDVSQIHRRFEAPLRHEHPLYQQLVLLLRSYKELKHVCTTTSKVLRAVIMCELANKKLIALAPEQEETNIYTQTSKYMERALGGARVQAGLLEDCPPCGASVVVVGKTGRTLENEFLTKIELKRYGIKDLLKALNGEKRKEMGIKNLRRKIYREMRMCGLISIEEGVAQNKIIINDQEAWKNVYRKIMEECRSKQLSIETKILILSLKKINNMESLVVHAKGSDIPLLYEAAKNIKSSINVRAMNKAERLVNEIIKCALC
ncbi:hypothetical protein ENBRE01_0690 [Enteropsectra breve]|nr:hypothetical protein ENBRE01_0690 [Enteropsectra breve]